MMRTRIPFNDLVDLKDNEPTSYTFFNNLKRSEKMTLIKYNRNPNMIILQGNPKSKIKRQWL